MWRGNRNREKERPSACFGGSGGLKATSVATSDGRWSGRSRDGLGTGPDPGALARMRALAAMSVLCDRRSTLAFRLHVITWLKTVASVTWVHGHTHTPHDKAASNCTKLHVFCDQTGSVGAKASFDFWEQRLVDRSVLLHRFVCLQHARAMGNAKNHRLKSFQTSAHRLRRLYWKVVGRRQEL